MSDGNNKQVFTCSLTDLLTSNGPVDEENHIEETVNVNDGVAFNMRAVKSKKGDMQITTWLHFRNDEGEVIEKIFFPVTEQRFQSQYGGSNAAKFKKLFGPVVERLTARYQEQARKDGSVPAGAGASEDDIPF